MDPEAARDLDGLPARAADEVGGGRPADRDGEHRAEEEDQQRVRRRPAADVAEQGQDAGQRQGDAEEGPRAQHPPPGVRVHGGQRADHPGEERREGDRQQPDDAERVKGASLDLQLGLLGAVLAVQRGEELHPQHKEEQEAGHVHEAAHEQRRRRPLRIDVVVDVELQAIHFRAQRPRPGRVRPSDAA